MFDAKFTARSIDLQYMQNDRASVDVCDEASWEGITDFAPERTRETELAARLSVLQKTLGENQRHFEGLQKRHSGLEYPILHKLVDNAAP